jgi:hypothetical protein
VEVLTKGEVKKSKAQISCRFDDVMDRPIPGSETDELVAVTYRLGAARSAAERVSGKELLYFIDMAIIQACQMLSSARDPEELQGQQQ